MISLQEQAKHLPPKPGVYLFHNRQGKVIYVGKSINIRERVKSHLASVSEKGRKIVESSIKIEAIPVESELEALLLEATLIKKHLPRYNSAAKDDKHPLYIKITKGEDFPKVVTSRREDPSTGHSTLKDEPSSSDSKSSGQVKSLYFGPFPSSLTVRQVLKSIRKVFPYCAQKRIGKRGCLYSHINLCKPCPAEIIKENNLASKTKLKKQYRKNIQRIILLLSGKTQALVKRLNKEMVEFAKKEEFEKAKDVREQLKKLEYVTKPYVATRLYLENPNLLQDLREEERKTLEMVLSPYIKNLNPLHRIECYDVSHTGGRQATCSLVTFIDGEPEKNLYRRFKLKTPSHDDLAMLYEAIKRRLGHLSDWGKPDLIVIDGGKGQVAVAKAVLEEYSQDIPVIGLAKRHEDVVIPLFKDILGLHYKVLRLGKDNPAVKLLQRLRDESHRFARSYHFKLRLKELVA